MDYKGGVKQVSVSGAPPPQVFPSKVPTSPSLFPVSEPTLKPLHFKHSSNDSALRSVLLEKDANQASLLWHGASSKFTASIVNRFYRDNSLDKAKKVVTEVKVDRVKLGRIARIQHQKEELEQIRMKQKTMKSRIKQFLEERVEMEQRFEAAAVQIQRHVRGFLGRRNTAKWLYEREKEKLKELLSAMQRQINVFWTGTGEQASTSATKIQALYRGFRARQATKQLRSAAQKHLLDLQMRENAAKVIQQGYRLHYKRRIEKRNAALEAIRKRLLVLKLKSFWHRKKLFWACMRKKYEGKKTQEVTVGPGTQKRPSSAKRTGGGYAMVQPGRPVGSSLESTSENPVPGDMKPPQPPTKPPPQEVKRPTVPLIPRPRARPPLAPRPDQVLNQTVTSIEVPEKRNSRSRSDSPPKYLAPTTSFKYKTGVDASVEAPRSKSKSRPRKTSLNTIARPTLSRQQYIEENKRSLSADTRERNWKPTVGLTKEVKGLPPAVKETFQLPSSLHSEGSQEEEGFKPQEQKAIVASENTIVPLLLPERSFTYRPPVKQSLDFKEALPEYQDFLQKYGKNLKPDRPVSRSTGKSVGDLIRISARDSVKKAEL